jgi:hypothetical protein
MFSFRRRNQSAFRNPQSHDKKRTEGNEDNEGRNRLPFVPFVPFVPFRSKSAIRNPQSAIPNSPCRPDDK